MEEKEIIELINGWQKGETKATQLLMNFAYLKALLLSITNCGLIPYKKQAH